MLRQALRGGAVERGGGQNIAAGVVEQRIADLPELRAVALAVLAVEGVACGFEAVSSAGEGTGQGPKIDETASVGALVLRGGGASELDERLAGVDRTDGHPGQVQVVGHAELESARRATARLA